MIKAILLATGIIAFASTVAEAQQRQQYNRGGYSQNYRGGNYYRNNGNRYVQNNFYGNRGYYGGGNGAAWAAGIGGLAVGAILGSALSQPTYAYPAPVYPVAPVATSCFRQYVTLANGQTILATVCP